MRNKLKTVLDRFGQVAPLTVSLLLVVEIFVSFADMQHTMIVNRSVGNNIMQEQRESKERQTRLLNTVQQMTADRYHGSDAHRDLEAVNQRLTKLEATTRP